MQGVQYVFFLCLLPELIDPRHTRKMDIRDPHYIKEAIQAREKKVTNTRKMKRVPEANQQAYQGAVPSSSEN